MYPITSQFYCLKFVHNLFGNLLTFIFPLQVPSGYFICDCWLMLDAFLDRKLFRPGPGESRVDLAADEAVRVKKCMGSLRYLWRNSKGASHHHGVQELKDMLTLSPVQVQNREGCANDDDDEEEEAGEGSAAEDREEGPGESEGGSAEEGQDGGEESVRVDESDVGEGAGLDGDAIASSGEEGDVPATEKGSDGEDSMNAPTERMGESPRPPDSQVRPAGWLGGFYHNWKETHGLDASHGKITEDDLPNRHPISHEFFSPDCPKALFEAIAGISRGINEQGARELALCLVDVHGELMTVYIDGEPITQPLGFL